MSIQLGTKKVGPNQMVISRKRATLLLHSQIVGRYPWLRDILERDGCLRGKVLETLTKEQRRIIDVSLEAMITRASDEWVSLSRVEIAEGKTQCTLCGKKGIKWKCFIRNKISDEEMLVGSECVKHFGFRRDGEKTLDQLIKDAERLWRLQLLGEEFDGVIERLEGSSSFLDSQPIVIPSRLARPYLSTARELRYSLDKFLDGKVRRGDEELHKESMLRSWNNFRRRIDEIERHVKEFSGHPFAPTRAIAQSLIRSGNWNVIEMLRENELITALTLHRISERGFLRSLIPRWNIIFESTGAVFHEVHDTRPDYEFEFRSHRGIRFVVPHSKLSMAYGTMIFGEKPIEELSAHKLFGMSTLGGSYSRVVRELLAPMINRTGYRIENIHVNDGSVVVREGDDTFLVIEEEAMAKSLVDLALGFSDQSRYKVLSFFQSPRHRRYNRRQLDALREAMRGFGESPTGRRSAR